MAVSSGSKQFLRINRKKYTLEKLQITLISLPKHTTAGTHFYIIRIKRKVENLQSKKLLFAKFVDDSDRAELNKMVFP